MYYIYMLTNEYNTVLYTGVTNDVVRRTYEHKQQLIEGFTKRYDLNKLVYYETFIDINEAIKQEKQLKGYSRAKKNDLVNGRNSEWDDLYCEL